jgi:hypothetical protein
MLKSWYWHRFKLRIKCILLSVWAGRHYANWVVYFTNPQNVEKEMWLKGIRNYDNV